jgi:hypothetical protein
MKTHPLQIEVWGEDGEDLVSRGHHDPLTFLAAAVRYLKVDGLFYREAETPAARRELLSCGRTNCAGFYDQQARAGRAPGEIDWLDPEQAAGCRRLRKVEHEWWRWMPPHPPTGSEWDGMRYTRVEDGPGAGVFPVTILRGDA